MPSSISTSPNAGMNHDEHSGRKNAKVDAHAPTRWQVKQEAEMEEANGGEAGGMDLSTAAAGCSAANREQDFITVRIDMFVLHCPLCTLPLKPPIFQCELGHLACGACRAQLAGNRCHLCVHGASGAYGRCPGLDVFVRGVKVPCPYDEYGCRSHVAYCDAADHQRRCPCAPCGCPEPGCAFRGTPAMLLDRIDAEHTRPIILVQYGREWSLSLPLARRWHVLVEQERREAMFLLSLGALGAGAAVSLVCVRANAAAMPRYTCRIALELPVGRAVVMESEVRSSALHGGAPSPDDGVFVGVRRELLSGNTIAIGVRIDELRPAAVALQPASRR